MLQTLLNNYGVFSFTITHTGIPLSDSMIGRPNTMNQDSTVYANVKYWNTGAFVQDDWRIQPRLTLNPGLRYDIQTAPHRFTLQAVELSSWRSIDRGPLRSHRFPLPAILEAPRPTLTRLTTTSLRG
jgi:outer membrane receptor protein involved in Fe transport